MKVCGQPSALLNPLGFNVRRIGFGVNSRGSVTLNDEAEVEKYSAVVGWIAQIFIQLLKISSQYSEIAIDMMQ